MKPPADGKRFSAVLIADVVGYSRLVAQDVESTVGTLKEYRNVFSASISHHRGWVVNAPGDSILAEFANAADAVQSAVKIQDELSEHNSKLPVDRRMIFRIGISQGEVVADDHAIYGDEVNIAARLETLADPGGICISGAIYAEIEGKPQLQCEFLGEQQLKNISRLVSVYRIHFGEESPLPRAANPTVSRLNKPSIAVLPFANFGDDAEQEYFADGMTEDIITELSRFKSLLVIARNSTFVYKGRAVSVQQVGKDLGVQFVLEGSVRKAGKRVRITAQLIDAIEDTHLWAERFDRDMEDVFAIQDEIAQMIVANTQRRVEAANLEKAIQKPTGNMVAYDLLLRGKDHHHRRTQSDNQEGLKVLDKAIELDPNFALAYAWKACLLGQASARGYLEWNEALARESLQLAEKSRELDGDDSECHRILCELHIFRKDFDLAEADHKRAYFLNPNDPRIVAQRGQLYTWTARAGEGVSWIELARRLDPYPPDARADSLGQALFTARRYADALKAYKMIGDPGATHRADKAACHAMLNQADEAETEAAAVREKDARFSAPAYVEGLPYQYDSDRDHHLEALRKAGLN
ncbi:MAG: adenylate/guanylate cyclase domain-containing protein [SAR324 cluster bacterium]|nr:adenylate/guanylate cyclase domain-containing protein [SAR324 cluster bacterium]